VTQRTETAQVLSTRPKTEENFSKTWVDHRLTTACKFGFTVIYDEFNRSRPEANNVLLGVLEERLLELPANKVSEGFLHVHPSFSAIFTSNPEEYAGVHKTQDALYDRMINITVAHYDRQTETEITEAKSGLDTESASRIVDIVREFRSLGVHKHLPTVRACIMIAKVVALRGARVAHGDPIFHETCRDVLRIDSIKITHDGNAVGTDWLDEIITRYCSPSPLPHVAIGNGHVNGTKAQTSNGGIHRGEREKRVAGH
jgi:nitric oxide reductase NorQ protein